VWAALLETNYVLSYAACEQRQVWMLHLSSAVALAVIGVAALAAWRAAPPPRDPAETAAIARARFMAVGGLVLCAWFAIAIVAFEIPAVILKPCTA
jgi:hypothetical protein